MSQRHATSEIAQETGAGFKIQPIDKLTPPHAEEEILSEQFRGIS